MADTQCCMYVDYETKQIIENIDMCADSLRKKELLRHEIVHAMLYESGLTELALGDEYAVEWIAAQFPKLLSAFEQVDAL